MRRLLLLRHAKTERSQPGGRDQDRVLADRGRADAPKLGAYMVRHALKPGLAVVSNSARTRETWALVAAGDVEARQRLKEDFPTSALAVINFALKDWSRVHLHAGRLEHFVTPRSLEVATE